MPTAANPNPSGMNALNPRTAVGLNQTRDRMYLVTVDGRRPGFSEGMYLDELGTLLDSLGARNAINLDGGGSTTMAFDYYGDKSAGGSNLRSQLVNVPSGSERYNGTSLGVFAPQNPSFRAPVALPSTLTVLDDFEKGSQGRFDSGPGGASQTDGITLSSDFHWTGQESKRGFGSQELNLDFDNGSDGTGRLRLRHMSGGSDPGTQPGNNSPLGKTGYVGFLLKVGSEELNTGDFTASLMLDDLNDGDAGPRIEMGIPIDVIADGEWHLYQWNLADAAMWDSFVGGNGVIDRANITVDSVLLESPTYRGDAEFFLDAVSYNSAGDLSALVPEPSLASVVLGLIAVFTGSRRRR
ncbi:MAG: phosphodiester glycosidase family protein [Chthoniobacterales bacterium]|nr:phosphodiester glycosidase family protein [Chthoniobacterales bacterium]